ncbi:hypothetical protein SISNIDRAFT_436160 [Sistotremastrum niveocremeum HHB9708]|uniref:Ras GTPase-activating protein n=1 Tax=Sistotremastrum niveocremeum HHB9708 TaxID=1314777 RepID=A0A164ZD50_9AGAM|nr:hypothetical protein SISNIDRAFT_436160 [Sistotremastrum niveocremeum HHB9708]
MSSSVSAVKELSSLSTSPTRTSPQRIKADYERDLEYREPSSLSHNSSVTSNPFPELPKKSYGSALVGGRRIGRHLPRIVSGDTPDEVSRQSARSTTARAPEDELVIPGITGASDVTGKPGRLRLSRASRVSAAAPLPSSRLSAGLWADVQRHLLQAYEYLCHVGEAQQWIEGCLGQELGFGVVEMEEELRNGIVLAKLVRVFDGQASVRRIYEAPKLDFRHSDNINHFFKFVKKTGLPDGFIFELTDLYEKKNFPKVIYCIHALSHLLARRGLAERIGNLVGQLKFSDDQLQQTQKGLDNSGIALPNFGNVGKELAKEINEEEEVEIETEDERRDRLLLETEPSIIKLQAQARAFIVRKDLATQRARLRLAERHITHFQARCRASLSRQDMDRSREERHNLVPWTTSIQALARGISARRRWSARLQSIQSVVPVFVNLQAQGRGALVRRRHARLRIALKSSLSSIVKLQALSRASLSRTKTTELTKILAHQQVATAVLNLQGAARGLLQRRRQNARRQLLVNIEPDVVGLQAQARGALARRRFRKQQAKLVDITSVIIRIQAASRAFLAGRRLLGLIRGLRKASPAVVGLQALARARLGRQKHLSMCKALSEVKVVQSVGGIQSFARAALARNRQRQQTKQLEFCAPDVVGFQAAARGAIARNDYWAWRNHLHASHDEVIFLQALLRGVAERQKFRAKMAYYRANLDKVVKIQSLFRAKDTREQYRQLTMGKNVNVGTIKNFVHLLDDSEADFEDEIEVERLRKRVVENIRENQALETDVSELDVKIALVVQNVKSFEELIKARRRHGADTAAAHAARASVLAAHGDPFAGPNTLDHATKRKLELYQQLFYLLQTHGEYLARLFFRLTKAEIPDKTRKMTERVILTLFGYGQDRREEYLLLKLFQYAIHEESLGASVPKDVLRASMYLNIAVQYVRPKLMIYVRETLQELIREVIEQDDLDLETNPAVIHRNRINVEEMRTGEVSAVPKDVSFHDAINIYFPETRGEYIRNLQKLLAFTKGFVKAIVGSTRKMPYGIRCVAREALISLQTKFPEHPDDVLLATVCSAIYHRYINPAIVTPEMYDIVPDTIAPLPRKNLLSISKMLTQITSGSSFGEDTLSLYPLNEYVEKAIPEVQSWFSAVADVPEPEVHLNAHEFLDVAAQPKPILISPNEVYAMHNLLVQNLQILASQHDDALRVILHELGGVPNLGNDELKDARDRAVTLTLTNRFAHVQDPHAEEKALWVQAKRSVLAILRVQPAKDLVESLMQPVAEEHESLWEVIVERELTADDARNRQPRLPSTGGAEGQYRLEDIQSLSFREVKAHAISCLLQLEKHGKVTRADGYQGILNAIAGDVRSKHRKRMERQNEMKTMHEVLSHLAERKKHYLDQIRSYHSYVDTAMETMQRGKGKKRFVMPFTKQYFHLRELQKTGVSPKFGSYRYSAQGLYDKGILLSIDQFSPRQFDRIDFVISSNQVGVFTLEVHNLNMGTSSLMASADLRMDDLLHAQFEDKVTLALFDGMAKMNLNLLLYQINKK